MSIESHICESALSYTAAFISRRLGKEDCLENQPSYRDYLQKGVDATCRVWSMSSGVLAAASLAGATITCPIATGLAISAVVMTFTGAGSYFLTSNPESRLTVLKWAGNIADIGSVATSLALLYLGTPLLAVGSVVHLCNIARILEGVWEKKKEKEAIEAVKKQQEAVDAAKKQHLLLNEEIEHECLSCYEDLIGVRQAHLGGTVVQLSGRIIQLNCCDEHPRLHLECYYSLLNAGYLNCLSCTKDMNQYSHKIFSAEAFKKMAEAEAEATAKQKAEAEAAEVQ